MRTLRPLTDGLDVVSVRVVDESAVVVLVIVGSNTRRSVVVPAGRECGFIERVDGGAVVALEGDVSASDGITANHT